MTSCQLTPAFMSFVPFGVPHACSHCHCHRLHMSSSLWTWSTVFSYASHPTRPTSCEYSVQRRSSDLVEDFTRTFLVIRWRLNDCVLSLSWHVCQFVCSLPPHSAETGTWKATRLGHYSPSPSTGDFFLIAICRHANKKLGCKKLPHTRSATLRWMTIICRDWKLEKSTLPSCAVAQKRTELYGCFSLHLDWFTTCTALLI